MLNRKVLLFLSITLLFVLSCMTTETIIPTPPIIQPVHTILIPKIEHPSVYIDDPIISYWSPKWYFVCTSILNIRSSPYESSIWLGFLENNTNVLVRGWSNTGNGWAMISLEGDMNWPYSPKWVNGDYLCSAK